MASGASAAINPIIEAMFRSAQTAQANRNQVETTRSNQADESLKKQQLQQAMDIATQTHDLERQRMENEHSYQSLMLNHQQFVDRLGLINSVNQGNIAIPPGTQTRQDVLQFPGGYGGFTVPPGQGTTNIMGQDLPTSQLISPQQRLMQTGAEEIAKQNARMAVEGPKEEAAQRRQDSKDQTVLEENRANTQRIIESQTKLFNQQRELEGLKSASAERIAAGNNATRLHIAATTGQDPGENTLGDVYLNGSRALPTGKIGNIVESNAPKGWVPAKDANDILKGVPVISDIFQKARELANLSSDIPLGGYVGTIKNPQYATRLRDEIQGQLGQISRDFGGFAGRISNLDVGLAQNLLDKKSLGKTAMLKQIDDMQKQWTDKLKGGLAKYPEDQRNQILANHNIHPDDLGFTTMKSKFSAIGAGGHRIVSDDGQNWKDAQTGAAIK